MSVVRIGLCVALPLCWSLLPGVTAHAQTPAPPASPASAPRAVPPPPKPANGFVSPYEIVRTVRAAGLQPLSRPLREGGSYVLRATDFRGIPMRVVLDARTGVIRDATRIIAVSDGPYGISSPYGPPPYPYPPAYAYPPPYAYPAYAPPPYGEPADYYEPPAPRASPVPNRVPLPIAAPHPAASVRTTPPLPRPRPAELAAKAADRPQASSPAIKPAAPGSPAVPHAPSGAASAAAGSNTVAPEPSATPRQPSPGELIEN